jgi:hypothetical protein
MASKKIFDLLGLMSREIVGDDVDLAASGLRGSDLREESDELGTGVSAYGAAENLTGSSIEGGIQRQGSVAEVLEAVSFRSTGRQRQDGVETIERLDGGFLVNAENGRMLRRVHVEADDVRGLLLKVRIIGQHVSFETMRLQSRSFPDPSHHHMADSEVLREFARGPVRRTIRWTLPRPFEDTSFRCGRTFLHTTTRMPGEQTRESVLLKALLPPADVIPIAPQGSSKSGVGVTIGEAQDQLCSANVSSRQRTGASPPAQLPFLVRLQSDGCRCHAS